LRDYKAPAPQPCPIGFEKSKTTAILYVIITLHETAYQKNRRPHFSSIDMKIKDHDLRQLNEERLKTLQEKDPAALLQLANRLLDDLKEARERLNQNPSNSSCPSGSQAPWFGVGDEDSPEDDEQGKAEDSSDEEPLESDSASSGKEESGNVSSEKDEAHSNEQPKKKAGKGPSSKSKNKPGKPPGAQGFGRPKELIINETTHHYPDQCAICGDHLPPESAVAHNAFYTIELILGGPESPGLTLWVTKHIYYTIACACQHENKEMPYRALAWIFTLLI
jgi:transposase